MFVNPMIEEINRCPEQVLTITEEVSKLIGDIGETARKEQPAQFPLYLARIRFLDTKSEKQEERIRRLAASVESDESLSRDAGTAVAVLDQQLKVLDSDRKELARLKTSLEESYSKLKDL